jgi:glycogen operon protein
MDSLRYWIEEMHVDGFRFDLATTLARDPADFDPSSSFLDAVAQDPVLSRAKLIAEPWDLGPDGHRTGGFPAGWAEWNDRYRDVVRRFWKGDPGHTPELASRLSGSGDIFDRRGRRPWASINFVTAHDGFTLRDLVSYDQKHNEANREDNRDGAEANDSWNCGVEGPSDDPEIRALRLRQSKNLLSTLLLSQGVPMLVAGDEFGRSQGGNNNAYCQDNDISWLDWDLGPDDRELLAFVRRLVRFRREHIAFHRYRFFRGQRAPSGVADVTWLRSDGAERETADWEDPEDRVLGFVLNGEAMGYHLTARGEPEADETFLVVLNGQARPVAWRMPGERFGRDWRRVLSSDPASKPGETVEASETCTVGARTAEVFVRTGPPPP